MSPDRAPHSVEFIDRFRSACVVRLSTNARRVWRVSHKSHARKQNSLHSDRLFVFVKRSTHLCFFFTDFGFDTRWFDSGISTMFFFILYIKLLIEWMSINSIWKAIDYSKQSTARVLWRDWRIQFVTFIRMQPLYTWWKWSRIRIIIIVWLQLRGGNFALMYYI